MQKIKVLHIIKSLGRGGAEMLLPETLALHDQHTFEFHYMYFLPWKDQVVGEIRKAGGVVVCVRATNNLKIIASVTKIAQYIKQNSIQLVHCHLPWAGIAGRIAGRIAGVPVVYTEHNKWERYHKLTFNLNKITFGWQNLAVAVSEDVAHSIKTFYRKSKPPVEVVLNGVNTTKFCRQQTFGEDINTNLSIPASAKVIGTVSVFRSQKRLTLWLEIAKAIHDKHPDTYFIIVGDGPLKDEVHAKAAELKMQQYVHFAGLQTEVRPYFKAMDIFMMSSEFEGLPIALLEAMSMECIPVCTNAGGIKQVVEDGRSGLLVDVNDPKELITKVYTLLSNWQQSTQLKLNARQRVHEHFSLKTMVLNLEQLYKAYHKKQSV